MASRNRKITKASTVSRESGVLLKMIKRVHVKNFRSFREATIELGFNNVLVGANMAGKSNFIAIFRFMRDLLFSPQQGTFGLNAAFTAHNGFAQVAWRGADNPLIEFQLEGETFAPERFEWKYSVSILGNFQWGTTQVNHEELFVRTSKNERTLIDTVDQRRRLFKLDGTQISETADTARVALEYDFPEWEGNILRNSVRSWRFYNLIPPLMRQQNSTVASTALNVFGDNLSAWLMMLQTRYPESFERIRKAALDVFPTLENIFTNPTPQSTVFLSSKERHLKRPITVTEMSDGELKFLAMLSLIYAPLDFGADMTFVEEPENHLHPQLLSVLVGLLRQVQLEFPDNARGQLFITTHSPFLVDKFSLEELIILNKEDGATRALRPPNRKELLALIADTEAGLGDLYYSGALTGA